VQTPLLGFGVYQIPAEQTEQAVIEALAAGYHSSTPPPSTRTRRPSAGPLPPAASRVISCW
jgi:hypothetical protein